MRLHLKYIWFMVPLALQTLSTGLLGQSSKQSTQEQNPKTAYSGRLEAKPLNIQWDFGFVPIDYKLVYTAPLRNIGADSLHIESVKSSCECTHPKVNATYLAPGEETRLTILFDTKNFYGAQSRFVELKTSDPYAAERIVQFKAIVGGFPEKVDMRPRSVFNLPGTEVDTIKIRNATTSPISFSVVYQDTTLFQIETTIWSVKEGGYAELYLRANDSLPAGAHFSTFTLQFDTNPPIRMSTPVKIVRY